MTTPTKEELQEATNMLLASDLAIISEVQDLIAAFESGVAGIVSALPDNPSPATPAVAFLLRLRTLLSSQTAYELNNLLVTYGLSQGNLPPPPPSANN